MSDAEQDFIWLRGPIDRENGKLVMRIPLDAGGEQLAIVAKGISEIDGDDLLVTIPHWLAQKIGVSEGSEVYVDDRWGKFNITKAAVE
jgi:hypothetical protein